MMTKQKKPTGAQPDRLKIEGDWAQAVEKSMKKTKPAEGWPKPKAMPQRAKKAKASKK
jgi:hypothetical protein